MTKYNSIVYASKITLLIRWLLANDKRDLAEKVYRKMARVNKIDFTEEAFSELSSMNDGKANGVSLETSSIPNSVLLLYARILKISKRICKFCTAKANMCLKNFKTS